MLSFANGFGFYDSISKYVLCNLLVTKPWLPYIFLKKDSEAMYLSKLSENVTGCLLQDFSEPCHSTLTRRS